MHNESLASIVMASCVRHHVQVDLPSEVHCFGYDFRNYAASFATLVAMRRAWSPRRNKDAPWWLENAPVRRPSFHRAGLFFCAQLRLCHRESNFDWPSRGSGAVAR
jgi:hypothetical protein